MAASRKIKSKPSLIGGEPILHVVTIDDPNYAPAHEGAKANPRKSTAVMNLRESPIAMMAARGHLAEHQVRAAVHFRRLWETLGGAGAGSFDYSREPVDGGGHREPITDSQIDAGLRLKQCQQHIGQRAFAVVEKVAGEGVSVSDLGTNHRERTTLADYLKHALEDLAELWGYKSGGRRAANAR